MVLLAAPSDLSPFYGVPFLLCPCKAYPVFNPNWNFRSGFHKAKRKKRGFVVKTCVIPSEPASGGGNKFNVDLANSARRGTRSIVLRKFPHELSKDGITNNDEVGDREYSNFASFQQDPIVAKLRTQLGVIHPIPSPPINRNVAGLFVFFFFVGVVFDKVWTRLKRKKTEAQLSLWRQTPTSLSMFLEKDLQRKESVEWVNMVLGKLWKVYRAGLENWLIGLLQPVIDDIKKPDYVERVEVKQFSLGDEPLSVRSVERRTSRRVNDLQ